MQATASFALASLLMESDSDADKAKGRELFVEISTRYADVEGGWAQRAKGTLFELENLQIGMIAPDFAAVDQDARLEQQRHPIVLTLFGRLRVHPVEDLERELVVAAAARHDPTLSSGFSAAAAPPPRPA